MTSKPRSTKIRPSTVAEINGSKTKAPDDDNVLEIDMDYMTVGEIEIIEELTGMSIDQFATNGVPKGKMMRAVGLCIKRRDDPDYTWEQAGDLRIDFRSAIASGQTGAKVPPTASGE